jgi:Tol biopolymer transport system component
MDKINGLRYAFRIAIGTLLMFLALGGVSSAITEVQLTTSTSDDQFFVISPDGAKIAFSSGRSGADEIWVMNADGSGQTKLTNLGQSYNPVWSPNGNEIAFERGFPDPWNSDVWKISADGSVVTQLTNSPGHQADPQFSPNGTKIIYESGSSGWAHVWIMNSDGTSQTPLATEHPMDIYGTWSPDGNKISYEYASNYYMPTSLAIMNPDGSGKTTILTTPNAYQGFQSWSPDSTKIVFGLSTNPTPTWNFENSGVYIINIDGSGYAKIANGNIRAKKQSWQSQVWSPDGSKIVYFSNDSGNLDIWMMNSDGTGKEQLTTNSGEDYWPIFSPDGKRVIFQTKRNGNLDIYAIELIDIVPATVDVNPDTLNKASKGGTVTAYIEIPGYDINNIDVSTVRLSTNNRTVSAQLTPTSIGDYDSDGIPDRMVKFDRQAVIGIVDVGDVVVTISGKISGKDFEGTDMIRVIGKQK